MRDFALTYQADRSYLDMALYLHHQYSPELTAVFLELPAVVSPVYWFFVEPEVYIVHPHPTQADTVNDGESKKHTPKTGRPTSLGTSQ